MLRLVGKEFDVKSFNILNIKKQISDIRFRNGVMNTKRILYILKDILQHLYLAYKAIIVDCANLLWSKYIVNDQPDICLKIIPFGTSYITHLAFSVDILHRYV